MDPNYALNYRYFANSAFYKNCTARKVRKVRKMSTGAVFNPAALRRLSPKQRAAISARNEAYRQSPQCVKRYRHPDNPTRKHPRIVPLQRPYMRPYPPQLMPPPTYTPPPDHIHKARLQDYGKEPQGTEFYLGECPPHIPNTTNATKPRTHRTQLSHELKDYRFNLADIIAWKNRDIYDQYNSYEAAEKWLHKLRHPNPNKPDDIKLVLYSVIDDLYCPNCDNDRYTDIEHTHQYLCNKCHEEHTKNNKKKQPTTQQQQQLL